jgi:uncharacterized membrane protein YeiH
MTSEKTTSRGSTIKERLTGLETNMEWVKKQQYLLLSMQLSMLVALIIQFIKR